jgi:hypothetical protein
MPEGTLLPLNPGTLNPGFACASAYLGGMQSQRSAPRGNTAGGLDRERLCDVRLVRAWQSSALLS